MKSVVVIPARLASTRLPQKLLLCETGKTVLQHTFESASTATKPAEVWIAADHQQLMQEAAKFTNKAILTREDHPSGTDRVAEVAMKLKDADIVVNVQGDEPELPGEAIDQVISLLENDSSSVLSTLATPIRNREQLEDPGCVKVVFNQAGRAMYFSRSVIPHPREWNDQYLTQEPALFYQHIGIYAYRRDFLLELCKQPPSSFEQTEKLEQLRVLEAGHSIQVGVIDEPTQGIDTLKDYQAFVKRYQSRYDTLLPPQPMRKSA